MHIVMFLTTLELGVPSLKEFFFTLVHPCFVYIHVNARSIQCPKNMVLAKYSVANMLTDSTMAEPYTIVFELHIKDTMVFVQNVI